MPVSSVLDSGNNVKKKIHEVMGVLQGALRGRERELVRQVDTWVKLEQGDEYGSGKYDDKDGGGDRGSEHCSWEDDEDESVERWRLVGNWRELQDVVERFGRVVEVRRRRKESFEVLSQESFDAMAMDTRKEKRAEDKNGEEVNDDDDEGDDKDDDKDYDKDGFLDDDDMDRGFVFRYNNTDVDEMTNDKDNYNTSWKPNTQARNETYGIDQITMHEKPIEMVTLGSFQFKWDPGMDEAEKEKLRVEDSPFKFTFEEQSAEQIRNDTNWFKPYVFILDQSLPESCDLIKNESYLFEPYVFQLGNINIRNGNFKRQNDNCSNRSYGNVDSNCDNNLTDSTDSLSFKFYSSISQYPDHFSITHATLLNDTESEALTENGA